MGPHTMLKHSTNSPVILFDYTTVMAVYDWLGFALKSPQDLHANCNNTLGMPTLQDAWGVTFIACFLDAMFYGAALLTVAHYFNSARARYSGQKLFTQLVVTILCGLASLHFFAVMDFAYNVFVKDVSKATANNVILTTQNPATMTEIIPSANIQLIAAYLIAFFAQMFYSLKIWLSTRSIIYIIPIMILSFMQIGAGTAQTILTTNYYHTFCDLALTKTIFALQGCATAACDLLISFVLCYDLRDQHTGFRQVDGYLDKLSYYAINRGIITSIAAMMNMILFLSRNKTFDFQIPLFISAHLYVISIVSMLITEDNFKTAMKDGDKSIVLSGLELSGRSGSMPVNSDVQVETAVTWEGNKGDVELESNSSNP